MQTNSPFKFSICFRQVPPVRARRSREPPRPHAQQQLPEVAAVRAGEAVPAAGERGSASANAPSVRGMIGLASLQVLLNLCQCTSIDTSKKNQIKRGGAVA